MKGEGGGNSLASTGSFIPNEKNSVKKHHGKDHYGLPMHVGGLSFHEKTLLGLMGWWMAMNIIGIFYALFAIDWAGDGVFQSPTGSKTIQKILSAFTRVISLGVFATRPRPRYDNRANPPEQIAEGGGKSACTPSVLKFLVALLGFLFLGVLFPSKTKNVTESFFSLGDLPDFFGKSNNKPGDIMGNASNVVGKLTTDKETTSTLTKEHTAMLENINKQNSKFTAGLKDWEDLFDTIKFGAGESWESKEFARNADTYYKPKDDAWKGWRKDS